MKLSKYFYVTLRETPSDATMPSHIFLMRGGYIKPVSTGIYSMMPMGFRVIQKIVNIIREEMNKIGGIEVDLPVVQTAELWSESGRYQAIGEELLRFKDRNNHNMVLAMTHEEAMTDLVRYVLNSYKQLPVMLYQFKTKYRDEVRALGEELGIPHNLVWRHPFPGPGLGVRLLCSDGVLANDMVKFEDVKDTSGQSLADYLKANNIAGRLLPIKSVGVQGDGRTYVNMKSLVV